jgi:putative ABC transport system permease protein
VFAALNTMYAAETARAREIASLRGIVYVAVAVVASENNEAMLLALAGGLIGAFLAFVLFNGMTVSTLGGGFTQLVFQFRVTPGLVVYGAVIALLIGFVGGLFPAVRAARLPVTTALRAG